MSAPCESVWVRYGVLKVASTMSGRPASWATLAIASRSLISSAGLEHDSQKMARVFSLMAAAKLDGSWESTKVQSMPMVGRMSANMV